MQRFGCKVTSCAAVALTLGVMTGAAGHAATITSAAAVSNFTPALGADVAVSQFNASLGTLTAASVSLTGQFTPQVSFSGGPPSIASVQFNPQVGLLTVASPLSVQFPIVALQSPGVQTVPVGGATVLTGTAAAISINVGLPTTNPFLSLAGSGSLDFHLEGSSGLTPGTVPLSGSLIDPYVDQATLQGGQVAVTYTYTPSETPGTVPEPRSLALLGGGLLGLISLGRRRQGPTAV